MFITDRKAVLGLPLFLTVATFIASIILAIFICSLINIQRDSQKNQIEYQIDQIVAEAKNMYEYADDGSLIHKRVEFPGSMKMLVFGALPTQDEHISPNSTIDENTSNNYYYIMDTGEIFTFHSSVRFSSENTTKIAVLYPGSYEIIFELLTQDGKTYVTIST